MWANLTKADVHPALPFSTIHGVKGQQFPAAAVVLPSQNNWRSSSGPTALDHWEGNSEGEPRRVLYVGTSRAQRLPLLLTPKAQTQRVLRLLTRDAVPFTPSDRQAEVLLYGSQPRHSRSSSAIHRHLPAEVQDCSRTLRSLKLSQAGEPTRFRRAPGKVPSPAPAPTVRACPRGFPIRPSPACR